MADIIKWAQVSLAAIIIAQILLLVLRYPYKKKKREFFWFSSLLFLILLRTLLLYNNGITGAASFTLLWAGGGYLAEISNQKGCLIWHLAMFCLIIIYLLARRMIKEVSCSNSTILKRLRDILLAVSGTKSISSDNKQIEIVNKWNEILLQLQRLHLHLFLLTGFDGELIESTSLFRRHSQGPLVITVEDEVREEPICKLELHNWRDAWLKNSARTKHIVYCTLCIRTKYNDDGSVQQWLLDQGYKEKKGEPRLSSHPKT
ncbi:hypothetical protein LCGC14_2628010 [marine sediment metagenome]|uniref:Uncharacterized protein n=1 Tax=marine sediment metagenome TaxID=412755 RepID=A0A0F9A193_9ZZZZ